MRASVRTCCCAVLTHCHVMLYLPRTALLSFFCYHVFPSRFFIYLETLSSSYFFLFSYLVFSVSSSSLPSYASCYPFILPLILPRPSHSLPPTLLIALFFIFTPSYYSLITFLSSTSLLFPSYYTHLLLFHFRYRWRKRIRISVLRILREKWVYSGDSWVRPRVCTYAPLHVYAYSYLLSLGCFWTVICNKEITFGIFCN